ncbi:uncharacterized protein PGTG_17622 [Puccinia graminis f. sp. tritici CRL 75-36-700-3]|uniref:Uncharacterized protein n=1 Tax=Puccinia graminis f. sp. tritici (strain CRL 75-36-700-3 / race SCCL) TaxID=418459 RepID=E3L4U3_PUCGT|nr:uncharacterized protein PGTG_17622 [Puccinia graminis f. sp. tritici CRL 75-36-700-3]EFP91568.1 hypothetical protein PGTG_17622 [Puccinia graminis f. sp. tritici CRL 75-36-700-3]
MKIHLLGYGSAAMALLRDNTYLLSGRLICPNLKTPPLLYYDQDLTFPMGPTESLPISLSNKTAVWGYGIVVSKHERTDSALGQSNFQSLFVVMKHTDYDNQSKTQVSFNVSYKIPGNRNLAKTFGLFQLGREMLLSGTLTGYDKSQKMLQVQALSVSLSTGPDALTTSSVALETSVPQPRKQYQINFDSDDEADTETPIVNSSTSDLIPGPNPTDTPASNADPTTSLPGPKRRYNKKTKTESVTGPTPGSSAIP